MSIFIDENTRLVVQGITGGEGSFHTRRMIEYGTQVVAGVTPGKGGQNFENKVPVFNTVDQAVKKKGANCSIIFVPPPFAADAIMESSNAGIELIVCITEGIPITEMIKVRNYLKHRPLRMIRPNCSGIILPTNSARRAISSCPSALGC